MPTYNFCVVVDDWDMRISMSSAATSMSTTRRWQINIFRALGAPLPQFGHCPMILGDDGEKLSKRRGAVSVTQYEDAGYLPEAMLNYLARLGWSHGDDELFSREQLVAVVRRQPPGQEPGAVGPGQAGLGQRPLPEAAPTMRALAELVAAAAGARAASRPRPTSAWRALCALFKDRCATTVELADWIGMYFVAGAAARRRPGRACHRRRAPGAARRCATGWPRWPGTRPSIAAAIKDTLAAHGLKMPQLAHAVRVLVCGRAQTPSLDAVLALFTRETVLCALAGSVIEAADIIARLA